MRLIRPLCRAPAPLLLALALAGCSTVPLPPWQSAASTAPQPARPGTAQAACAGFAQRFAHPGLRITATQEVAEGALKLPGIAQGMPAHCVVTGRLNERSGPVDNKPYAIGFEMRLPTQWNGRFFYQANGGLDGFVTPAYGHILGGGPTSNGLLKGFAVLSSDAGHAFERDQPVIGAATFGRDPQARLDYGYNAVAQLTPMARALIAAYYGRPADKAYLVGSSNGGRHGMVAAARDIGGYDGMALTTPGYNLPLAAVAQVWGAQQFAQVARATQPGGIPGLETSFTPAELETVSQAVLARCDALDGTADGIVADLAGCQRAFDLRRDLPSCSSAVDSAPGCLSAARKEVLARVFAGPGLYAGLPWDAGLRGRNWREWKFTNSIGPRDAVALAFVFTTPPDGLPNDAAAAAQYALKFSLDKDALKVHAKNPTYAQSAMEFMTPPQPQRMDSFVRRGGKLLVAHGSADPVFSALDTVRWYEAFQQAHGARAADSARLFIVPGMNHSSGGPATDQFDLVDALVRWVEEGVAPDAIVAAARGPGANVPNNEVPATWSAQRTRLLCPWPAVPRHRSGDAESASSFACAAP
jgi:hypothetical protein